MDVQDKNRGFWGIFRWSYVFYARLKSMRYKVNSEDVRQMFPRLWKNKKKEKKSVSPTQHLDQEIEALKGKMKHLKQEIEFESRNFRLRKRRIELGEE